MQRSMVFACPDQYQIVSELFGCSFAVLSHGDLRNIEDFGNAIIDQQTDPVAGTGEHDHGLGNAV